VPCSLKNSCQKFLVKMESLLKTTEWGTPWSFKIFSMNIWSSVDAVNGCWRENKWAYLERRWTMTMITNLLSDLGRHTMKYIEISHQIEGVIGSGWSVLCSDYFSLVALIDITFNHKGVDVLFHNIPYKRTFDLFICFGKHWIPSYGWSMKLKNHHGFKLWLFS